MPDRAEVLLLPYRGVWPRISPEAFLAPGVVIAGDVNIEAEASVWFGAVLRGDSAPIHVGARTNIQDGCVLHTDAGMPCAIGADCSLGHGAVVHGATLEAGVLVGMHATVLNGAVVGAGSLIAAGALVAEGKRIVAGQVVMGVPGRALRPVSGAEQERMREGIGHYLTYAREYRAALALARDLRTQGAHQPTGGDGPPPTSEREP